MAVEKGVGFPITAVDQFSGTFATLKNRVTGLHGDFGRLNGVVSTLTAGLGLAGFGAFIKSTIDAHDEVNKLAQKVGIAVGELSTLKYAAQLSDVSTQALSAGVKGLSQRMIEATDSTSKAGRLMAAMGVDIRGGTLPAIERMADVFKTLPDGPTKAALAVEIFGKAGMDMIPLLNQGTEGMRAMRAEAVRLGLVMSEETAAAAEKFNDNMRAVKASSEGLGVTMLNSAAPGLVRISEAMKQAATDSGILMAAWVGLGGVMAEIFGLNDDPLAKRIREIGDEIASLQEKIAAGPKDLGGGVQDRGFINQYIERVRVLRGELRAAKSLQDAMAGKFDDQASRAARQGQALPGARVGEGALASILGGDEARKKALADAERLRQLDLRGWVAYADAVFAEADETNQAIAKINEERWRNEDKLRDDDLKGWVAYADAVFAEADETNLAIAKSNEERWAAEEGRWSGFIGGIEGAFRQGWDSFTGGARNAGQVARDALKRTFFDWLWQQFARPFVLNVVGSAAGFAGMTGLSNAAGAGGGNWLSTGGSILSGASGLGSLLPGGEIGTAVGNFANMGASMFGAGGSLASTIGSVASFLPAIGTAVAVAAMLYNAFNDGPENPNMRILQGQGGAGLFGGISTQGNYSWDSTGLTNYIGGLDARFARVLGPSGTAAASAGLSAYTQTGLRMDGTQPAQFAFPEGDATAAEQLAKEVLQSRYGIIFAQIDAGIAEQIRAWSGSSTELQAFIETSLGIVESIGGLGITGLNITTLQQMQREGESLGQTFQRVGGEWARFNQLFTTEAERLGAAQMAVTTTFADLGIAVPESSEAFASLVRGLDLSTESGRKMFDALMGVAPAFSQVATAARGMLATFDSIMGQMRGPAYTSSVTQGLLEGAVGRFMGLNSWTQGMTTQQVAGAFSTITREDFQRYSPESQAIITEILGYQQTLASSASTFTEAVISASGAASDYAGALKTARDGLRDWTIGKLLGDQSALSPTERLSLAMTEYERATKGSDLSAFQGAADALLGVGRDYYASGEGYTEIFNRVISDAQKKGGFNVGFDGTAASIDQMRSELAIELRLQRHDNAALRQQVTDLIATLRQTSKEQTTATREAAAETSRAVIGAVESVAR